jgi:hypothetical protein
VALVSAGGIPLLFLMGRRWTDEVRPRLHACLWYAACPGQVLFFPVLDQVLAVPVMAAFIAWAAALDAPPRRALVGAVAVGLLLFGGTFLAYNPLAALGFLAPVGLVHASTARDPGAGARRLAWAAAVALTTAALAYGLLYTATGFPPIASLQRALLAHEVLALDRPWLRCVLYDPYLFVMGIGMIAVPLLAGWYVQSTREAMYSGASVQGDRGLLYAWLGLASIAVLDLSGLLPAEVPRLWLFLVPFAILPAAIQLAKLDRVTRWALYGALWLALVVINAKMAFVRP